MQMMHSKPKVECHIVEFINYFIVKMQSSFDVSNSKISFKIIPVLDTYLSRPLNKVVEERRFAGPSTNLVLMLCISEQRGQLAIWSSCLKCYFADIQILPIPCIFSTRNSKSAKLANHARESTTLCLLTGRGSWRLSGITIERRTCTMQSTVSSVS